ncbi:hypothetical protein D1007_45368 [Hordeum vulgare]|nr:hypothetical protein D1007_45368 [Hordeum vulgare]
MSPSRLHSARPYPFLSPTLFFLVSGEEEWQHWSASDVYLDFDLPPIMAAVRSTSVDKMPRLPAHGASEVFDLCEGRKWQPWTRVREMLEHAIAGAG